MPLDIILSLIWAIAGIALWIHENHRGRKP